MQPGQSVHDRPDILSRVFSEKKKLLIEVIEKECFFKVKAGVHPIEFQKRGLPHVHLLIFFILPAGTVVTPTFVNNMISAELLPAGTPLRHIVETCLIHGPCGALNSQSPCMKNGCCTKDFPKPFRTVTELGEDSYALYRRRSPEEGGQSFQKMIRGVSVTVDNRFVVPYNPFLCLLLNATHQC